MSRERAIKLILIYSHHAKWQLGSMQRDRVICISKMDEPVFARISRYFKLPLVDQIRETSPSALMVRAGSRIATFLRTRWITEEKHERDGRVRHARADKFLSPGRLKKFDRALSPRELDLSLPVCCISVGNASSREKAARSLARSVQNRTIDQWLWHGECH
jgi:hypothetical protein